MLAIEVEFLTGRYVATAYNSRSDSEWPPEPARLFSALVATHFASESPSAAERAALEWLEAQGAPQIAASGSGRREIVVTYVPVNDVAMTDVDGEVASLDAAHAAQLAAERAGDAKGLRKATALVGQLRKRLDDATRRAVQRPARATAGDAIRALKVLPEHRIRQPRTFPSVTPSEPRVTFIWPDADPTPDQREAIDHLLARLVRLGHSSSLASGRLVDNPPAPRWWPAADGESVLRTVQRGQLAALERAHALHRETEPRVMPARFQGYTRNVVRIRAAQPRSVFAEDWLVLRRVGGPSIPMVAAAGVARTLRRALMAHATEISEVMSGHRSDGRPSEHPHLAIVPLPFVGHLHASGAILGIALVLPRDTADADRRSVFAAVDAWERTERLEDEDTPRLPLHLGAVGTLELERIEWGAAQSSLRPATWCQPSAVWSSVTPVALDHNPGDLRSRDPGKSAAALAEASESIRRACQRIGLPEPESVEILPAAPLAGAAKSRAYPPFPEEPGRTRRVLTHARLRFVQPVYGPILIGAGRFLGLGLFRPAEHP